MSVDERRQLIRPPDQRELGWRRGAGRLGARPPRASPRGEAGRRVVHLLVQARSLLDRRDAELLAQRSDAGAVLLQRRCAVAAPGVQADQLPVGRLVEGVELQPAAARAEGRARSRRATTSSSTRRRSADASSRSSAPASLICQSSKSGLSRSEKPSRKSPENSATASLRLSSAAPSAASARKRSTSSSRSGPCRRARLSPAASIHSLADALAQRRERAPQRTASAVGVVGWPQQFAERLARARPLGEREMSQQRHRLAGVEGHWLAVPLHARSTEQRDLERHRATITAAETIP